MKHENHKMMSEKEMENVMKKRHNFRKKQHRTIRGDELKLDELKIIIENSFLNINEFLKSDGSYYICSPQGGEMGLMMMMMENCGIKCRHVLIWLKDREVFSMGRLDYSYKHEPILYGWKEKHNFYGKNEKSVWEIPRPKESKDHPTQKPIELCIKGIQNSSKRNDIVLDLFGGSGSTFFCSFIFYIYL